MNQPVPDPADPITEAVFPPGEASRRALAAALRETRRRRLRRRAPAAIGLAAAAGVVTAFLAEQGPEGDLGPRDPARPGTSPGLAHAPALPPAIAIVTTAGTGRSGASLAVSTGSSQVSIATVTTSARPVDAISDDDLLALAAAPGRPAALVAGRGGYVLVSARVALPQGTAQ